MARALILRLALNPEQLGFPLREAVPAGREVTEHARLNLQALDDVNSPARAQVKMTAGVILSLLGRAESPEAGIAAANECLSSGCASALLDEYRNASLSI